ncbi:MAG TPA: carbonic anhydrase [Candidatus Acidoferrum sp.]|nr:carbonic anhydrase [Candidatus Acidoferrum sp.]
MNRMSTVTPTITASAALARLIEGNARFMCGKPQQRPPLPGRLTELSAAQQPFATLLGCSDSRVPPEMIFDQGLGDLFIVRVAGNVVSAEILGSLGYALVHLRTPLFVVLGHEGCGAVQAALQTKFGGRGEKGKVAELLDAILPGLEGINASEPAEAQWLHAVEANVRWTVRQLAATPAGHAAVVGGRIQIVGAIYELATGRVRVLPPDGPRDCQSPVG